MKQKEGHINVPASNSYSHKDKYMNLQLEYWRHLVKPMALLPLIPTCILQPITTTIVQSTTKAKWH